MADHPAATTAKAKKPPKPGRKRRVVGWLMLAFGVVITGVWVAAVRCELRYFSSKPRMWSIGLEGRAIRFQWMQWPGKPLHTPGFKGFWYGCDWNSALNHWWLFPDWHFNGNMPNGMTGSQQSVGFAAYRLFTSPTPQLGGMVDEFQFHMLPWPFAHASLLGGGWLVWSGRRARRRAMTGVCFKCGYDLVGLAAGAPCPECGGEGEGGAKVIH